jgi:carbamoyltransferase
MATILGLNAYHGDSAACLVRDGALLAAAEEERFRRVKHWAGLPTQAMQFCLQTAKLNLSDIDHVALNRKPGVNNFRRLLFVLQHRPDFGLLLNRLRNIRKAASLEQILHDAFPGQVLRAQIHHVEHHLAHLASAFLVSPFEQAVCASVDGFGDFASAAWGMGQGSDIHIDGRVYFPHSLGIFYSAITQLIGFPWFGDEYKVMGLAPYGEPKYLAVMRQVVLVQPDGTYRLNLECFRHHNENVSYTWNDCTPEVGTLYTPTLETLLCPTRKNGEPLAQLHKDIARSAQAMYEEAFFALLNALHQKYRCDHLALSGGCAMNSVANGKVYLKSPFKKMYLPAAGGDAGGAIGAAFVVHHELQKAEGKKQMTEVGTEPPELGPPLTPGSPIPALSPSPARTAMSAFSFQLSDVPGSRPCVMTHAYTGPEFSDCEIEALLKSRGLLNPSPSEGGELGTPASDLTVTHYSNAGELCLRTARAISEGLVIGWFQGRMEWGPRALGNRSILGDPRRADMKEILNQKIKRRESFRPFAPSILREHVSEWFEQDDDVPFMMQVFQWLPARRSLIPAVCHVDGSGRLQTVSRDANPLYHQLISAFCGLTSVPLLLNTSFNENEPAVCRPEEALDCFLRTKMDVLVLGNYFIERTL